MEDRRSYAGPVIVSVLLLALALGVYVSGYFLLGVLSTDGHGHYFARRYPLRWQAFIYRPAAWAESAITETSVFVYATGDLPPPSPSPIP
jgi:hypothetical protein